jgi:hypothetical protein
LRRTIEAFQIVRFLIDRSMRCRKNEIRNMSFDEDNNLPEIPTLKRKEDSGIWNTATMVLDDDAVIEKNPLEIAKDASGLAWFAMWVSVVAIVISIASAAINLSS